MSRLDQYLPQQIISRLDQAARRCFATRRIITLAQDRVPLGSFERFVDILTWHFAAGTSKMAQSLWLAPEQMRISTVSEKFGDYGNAVLQKVAIV